MQKKLLAVVATLTIVLSMFSGITFAASYSHKILLSNATIVAGSAQSVGFHTVHGSIVRQDGISDGGNYKVQLVYTGGSFPASTYEAKGGSFEIFLPANLSPQDITLLAQSYDSNGTLIGTVASTTIKVRYNVTTDPSDLNFNYSDYGGQSYMTGVVTDKDGTPVKGTNVVLQYAGGAAIATATTNDAGQFGMLITKWNSVGPVELHVAGYLHRTGKVGGIRANLSVTPSNGVIRSIAPTSFKIEGSGFAANQSVSFTLRQNGETVTGINVGYAYADGTGAVSQTFSWTPTATGTYTLEATQVLHSASATITVVNPSGYNFVNAEQLTNLKIGDASANQLRIGKHSGGTVAGTYLATWDGVQLQDDFYYDVYVDGELKVEKQANAIVGIAASQYGTKQIRVIAYKYTYPSGSYTPTYTLIHEQTFVAKVSGWNVTIEGGTLTVNQARDVTFVVKDEHGVPINNATIQFDRYTHYPYSYNVQNGTYIFRDVKFSAAGPVAVVVKQGNEEKARLTLSVVGQKVYQITTNTTALLQGQSQTVRFNVSKGLQASYPQALEMEDANGKITSIPFTQAGSSGTYTAIDATINPELVGELIVRVKNYNGSECGEVKLKVVAPKIELLDTEAANVTENIKTKLRFRVVDPRDNSVIRANVNLVPEYAAITVHDAYDSLLWSNILLGANEYTISILATDAQYETASDKNAEVAVLAKVNGVTVGTFPVKQAVLESDPKMITIGAPTALTLTYKDANGKLITGKTVQVRESGSFINVGTTDSLGQVSYPAVQSQGSSVGFQAATDVTKKFVTTEVRAGYDSEKPKVTYNAESKTDTTTIVITDNVRLTRLRINGEDIDIFPGKRYEHTLKLQLGVNKFRIQAQDGNYNPLDETIEIKYVAGSTEPPVTSGQSVKYTIGRTVYYADGAAKRLEAAPFLRGDHTLVPVRALASIGAQFDWDNKTRTATFQLGSNVVKVTIGKATAIVNGKATVMPIAAEIVNDRTMVPFRFVGQSLGLQVDYVAATKDIIITRK